VTAALLALALVDIPREHAPLPAVARHAMKLALPTWKITEPVNEVVYGTRGFDTFGETFLLLAAVVSVVVLTRRREPRSGFIGEQLEGMKEQREIDPAVVADSEERTARIAETREQTSHEELPPAGDQPPATPDAEPVGTPAPEVATGMTVVIRVAARVASPILAIAGLYLVAWGYSPGGGFPAGAVLLGVILLLYAAYGYRRISRVVRPSLFEVIEIAGALGIIVVELLGLVLKGSFSANWVPLAPEQTIRSGGILQLFSGSELIEVGTGLTIVILAILTMRHDWSPDKDDES
jgi:multicomponent Na+:H+ antiporter subunit B